jgi:hypothetical protein
VRVVKYVIDLELVTDPSLVVTTTLFTPTVPAGIVNTKDVAAIVSNTAATPPTVTESAPVRFVPVIVLEAPPAVEEE